MKKDLLECKTKALLIVNAQELPRSSNGRKQGYMKIMKDLWEEKGYADLGFTCQHLRDQAAKLEKSVGNVRDLISVSVGSRENQNMSSTGEINVNCVANFQNANSSNITNLHTAERVLIPEEQVNTLNEETRVLVEGTALVLARVNMQEGEFIDREIDTRIKEKPTNNDLVNINRAIVELMQQHHISPTENPFSYHWVANSVLYSVVTVFLLQKEWKKQGPRSLRRVDKGTTWLKWGRSGKRFRSQRLSWSA